MFRAPYGVVGIDTQQTVFGPVAVRLPEAVALAGQLVGCVGEPVNTMPGE